jgi:hypothetical protein
MKLDKYSFGTGDRFGLQGNAQLAAVRKAAGQGTEIAIVWNKSHREHMIVGTNPEDVRREADQAIQAAGWKGSYHVDADHIGLANVDQFIESSDFFTLDVADFIGEKAKDQDISGYLDSVGSSLGVLQIEGLVDPLQVGTDFLRSVAEKYLFAIQQAALIYHYIAEKKGPDTFITEVSLDETDEAQTPQELYFILGAIAHCQIPAQTIAPKFSGRFNKGVDYQGDVTRFNHEFGQDVCVVSEAVRRFGLPANLKISVHSGSDKFLIYPGIREAIRKYDAGVHVKTAGTTWLEELIGLAESGGDARKLVVAIYRRAYARFDELCGPYHSVIDIDRAALPSPEVVAQWSGDDLVQAIKHDQSCARYDSNIRQLFHVAYKIAAEMGDSYLDALKDHSEVIGRNVCDNLFQRHIKPLFF